MSFWSSKFPSPLLFWIVGKSKFDNNFHSKPIRLSVSESKKSKKLTFTFHFYQMVLGLIIMINYEAVGNIYNGEGHKIVL